MRLLAISAAVEAIIIALDIGIASSVTTGTVLLLLALVATPTV